MHTLKKLLTGTVVTFAVLLGGLVSQAQADWQPRKPVEFIIMAGTGGGRRPDREAFARAH